MEYHNPVLLKETVDGLAIRPDGIYVDVTFGGGGHSREILKRLGPHGKLFAFDQDEDAWKNTIDDDRFTLVPENFRYIKRFLRFHGVRKVDGILADLGVSSHQFDEAERGFSTRFEAKLDMRMSRQNDWDAYRVINEYDEELLKQMFLNYGELKQAPALARTIVEARSKKPIQTTIELKAVLAKYLPAHLSNKILAQIYQAIRIEVNQEMDVLEKFLLQTADVLKPEGRLVVMSYHSLEDRLVKNYMKRGNLDGSIEKDFFGNVLKPFEEVNRKPILPTEEEIARNSRARSAKLRIAKRLPDGK